MISCTSTRTRCGLAALGAVAMLSACGGDSGSGTEPPPLVPPGLRAVAGDGASDTIDTQLSQPLVVIVSGDHGQPLPGVVVWFRGQLSSDPLRASEPTMLVANDASDAFGTFVSSKTDNAGRAVAQVRLGGVAGDASVLVSAPEMALSDTARFSVFPGRPHSVELSLGDTTVFAGEELRFGLTAFDRHHNISVGNLSYSVKGTACSLEPVGTLRGVSVGSCVLTAHVGFATGSVRVSVVPDWELVATEGEQGDRVVRFRLGTANVRTPVGSIGDYQAFPATSSLGHIAYRIANHLVLVQPSGAIIDPFPASAPLSWAGWPRFSADAQWVYFSGSDGIYRARTDGTGFEWIFRAGSATTPDPAPYGRRAVFAMNERPVILDMWTGATITPAISATQPRWSPDGLRIALISSGRIVVMSAYGTNPVPVSRAGLTFQNNSGLDWSADGEWLVAYSGQLEIIKSDGSDGMSVSLPGLTQFTLVR